MEEQPWQWFIERPDRFEHHMFACKRVLFLGQTPYQSAQVIDTFNFGKMLILDGKVQSAQGDEFIYHEALVHPAMMIHPNPRRVLIIGGGEGASLREVLRHASVEEVTMVDLDKEVVALSKIHLPEWSGRSFEDPRVKLVFGDGRAYLERTETLYDLIISDITDFLEEGPSLSLYTREFYQLVKSRLSTPGLLAVQALELSQSDFEGHAMIRSTLQSVYPIVRSYKTFVPSFWAEWGFIIASDQLDPLRIERSTLQERIRTRLKRSIERPGAERPMNRPGADRLINPIDDPLDFYDAETHYALFQIPKNLRALLAESRGAIEDNKPLKIGAEVISLKPARSPYVRNKIQTANGS